MPGSTHYLIVSLGTAGDLFPFLSVARALKARGARVTMLASGVFQDLILAEGVQFHALFGEQESLRMLEDPDLWHPRRGFETIWKLIAPVLARIPDFIAALPADEDCVVLTHPIGAPACAIARARRPGLRVVTAYLAPSNMSTCHDPMMLGELHIPTWMPMAVRRWLLGLVERKMINPGMLPILNRARAAAALAPVDNFWQHMQRSADASVALFPAWYAPTQPDWPAPMVHAGFQLFDPNPQAPLSPELRRFLDAGDAPIVFTPGTGYLHGEHYFRSALAAVQKLGRRAVFLTKFPAQLPRDLPGTVLWQEFVPLRALLPHAALLVYHGGIGTLAEALQAGVPQLVVPCSFDQFDNGRRVRELGLGATLQMRFMGGFMLARAMRPLLAAPLRAHCQAMAAKLGSATDTDAVCDLLAAK